MPYRFEGRGPRGFTRRVATAKVGNQIWRETRYMNDLVSVLEPADEHDEPGGPRGDEDAEWIPGFVRSRRARRSSSTGARSSPGRTSSLAQRRR